MPRPRNPNSKTYGRQAQGKTIKSLSLADDVVIRAQEEADARGISFSELVNGVLAGRIIIEQEKPPPILNYRDVQVLRSIAAEEEPQKHKKPKP